MWFHFPIVLTALPQLQLYHSDSWSFAPFLARHSRDEWLAQKNIPPPSVPVPSLLQDVISPHLPSYAASPLLGWSCHVSGCDRDLKWTVILISTQVPSLEHICFETNILFVFLPFPFISSSLRNHRSSITSPMVWININPTSSVRESFGSISCSRENPRNSPGNSGTQTLSSLWRLYEVVKIRTAFSHSGQAWNCQGPLREAKGWSQPRRSRDDNGPRTYHVCPTSSWVWTNTSSGLFW